MVMSHGGSAAHRSGPTRRASGPIRSVSQTVVVFNNGGHKTKTSRYGRNTEIRSASLSAALSAESYNFGEVHQITAVVGGA